MSKTNKSLTWKEFKEKDKGYKIGYIIGVFLMFGLGVFNAFIFFGAITIPPIIAYSLLIILCILLVISKVKKRLKKEKR
jgi:fatty acid desaturase